MILMNNKFEFIFYENGPGAPSGWAETLDTAGGKALARRLVSFAAEFSLTGNVWQQWLTYVLMMHENPFTLTCERRAASKDSTALKLAQSDLAVFMEMYRTAPEGMLACFTDYKALYDSAAEKDAGAGADIHRRTVRAGDRIAVLSERLAEAADADDIDRFTDIIADYYAEYGTGIFGLYRAFRISAAADGQNEEVNIIPVTDSTDVTFDDLIGCEEQKARLRENTEAFVEGRNANNVLLYGDSGTGKSTSIHALMHDFSARGLRLVEISKHERKLLPQVLAEVKKRNYRFIIFLDDLSFEENESDYKELKAMLEGALETRADRVLIYATSNRRHLIRETWRDRNDMEYQEDVHHSDTMEEKLSLASRFGVTIYYSKPDAKEYLRIVRALAGKEALGITDEELEDKARKWELRHGGMSGRTARQFITWLQSGQKDNN